MKREIFTTNILPKELRVEFNDLTVRAHGSVMVTYGETVILVTVVMGQENENLPYFPLSVEFEEKFYAAGEILGSRFVRREGKPSDEAILSARIVDRTIRPLFPKNLMADVQVVITVLAIGEDDPDVLAVIGTSLALGVSPIPWRGPVSAVRLSLTNTQEVIINPTYKERGTVNNKIELLACGRDAALNMIEAAGNEASEADIVSLLHTAVKINDELVSFQTELITKLGQEKKVLVPVIVPPEMQELYRKEFAAKLYMTIFSAKSGKDHIEDFKAEWLLAVANLALPNSSKLASGFFQEKVDETLHRGAVLDGQRADGRTFDEVRSLYAQAGGISPVLHGSGIFYRGETRIFSALTLGGPEAAQLVDTMEERLATKRFMHHYNFPPFSVGETGRVGGFNRRMIGHGALAEKALLSVIPNQQTFPYTIRLVSETMSSNGSSSMGSVCASSLALMDGGVPIKKPVAGIASGLMIYEGAYKLLTDIQGPEDEFGDMDFKVAGTDEGVTAIQMDVKVAGIKVSVLSEALDKARLARIHILETMLEAISTPREKISARAPKIITLTILPEQIGLVIGGGGKTVNGIKAATGVDEILIEDDGTVFITGKNGSAEKASAAILSLTKRYLIGDRVTVTITKITDFGAFAKLDEYNEGLIHVSEISPNRVESVAAVLAVGEMVTVLVSKLEKGKIGLSIKQCDPDFIKSKYN